MTHTASEVRVFRPSRPDDGASRTTVATDLVHDAPEARLDARVCQRGTLAIFHRFGKEVGRRWILAPRLELPSGATVDARLDDAAVIGGRRLRRQVRLARDLSMDELALFEDLGFGDRGWLQPVEGLVLERVHLAVGWTVTLVGTPSREGDVGYRKSAGVTSIDVRALEVEAPTPVRLSSEPPVRQAQDPVVVTARVVGYLLIVAFLVAVAVSLGGLG